MSDRDTGSNGAGAQDGGFREEFRGTVADRRIGVERGRGAGRRLSDSLRSAEEGELTTEQFLFLAAIDAFKKANGVSFPRWTDVLEVIRLLGYRKVQASELSLRNAADWRERSDAPAAVRPEGFERRFEDGEREAA